jgi:hypothetical protein
MTGRKIFPAKYAGFEILMYFCSLGLGTNPLQFSLDYRPTCQEYSPNIVFDQ